MDGLRDRAVAWLLRFTATAAACAGGALFVAAIPVLPATSGAPRDILMVVLQIGGALLLFCLPAARIARLTGGLRGGRLGIFRVIVGVALVIVPLWLVRALQPFLAEWRVVADLLGSSDLWHGANANMSGVVIVPLAGALAPPFIQLAAVATLVGACIAMVVLLAAGSPWFPRLYLASVVLLTALVIASARGAVAAQMAVDALRPVIETSKPRPEEDVLIRSVIDRYTAAVTPTPTALWWAWAGYGLWLPLVLVLRNR